MRSFFLASWHPWRLGAKRSGPAIRNIALLLLALAPLLLLTSCKNDPAAPGDGPLKLQLNWKAEPQFGGFYAARDGGAFAKHGLTVEVVPGGVGTPTVQMVGAGQVPFAVVSGDELLIARSKGNNVVALLAVYQTCPQAIMVHASKGYNGDLAAALRGSGRIAAQEGLPYFQYLIRKYGVDTAKVVPSPGGSITTFLNTPDFAQQCFITSEPILARKAGADPDTILVARSGYNPYVTVLVTRDDYLKAHPEVCRKMALACREGWEAYLADPTATNAAMTKENPGMDADFMAQSAAAQVPLIRTPETATRGLGSMTRERWATLGQQLVEVGVLTAAPPPEQCFADVLPAPPAPTTRPATVE